MLSFISKIQDNKLIVTLPGRFNAEIVKDMLNILSEQDLPDTCILDFSHTKYMDSTALGALLSYRNVFKETLIRNPTPEIRNILTQTNFNRLFEIINEDT